MKVRYSFEETLTFSGELEMTEEMYNDLKDKTDEQLGEALSDMVDKSDPQDWYIDCVDDFSPT